MKVMVFVKATKDSEAGVMPSEKLISDMMKFNEELVKAGIMKMGDGLQPSSKGKRIHFSGPKRTVIDGPFAETKEQLLGFYTLDCADDDAALEAARELRRANPHAVYEIRPIITYLPGKPVSGS